MSAPSVFSGGAKLPPSQQLYHKVMMLNELIGGQKAYEITWAGGKSGPTFGGNQMDISSNSHGRFILLDIARHCLDRQFADKIEIILQRNSDFLAQHPKAVFGETLLAQLNAALSSPYGLDKIDNTYVKEMDNRSNHIEKMISIITHTSASKFYHGDYGKLLLMDYHNQFNLARHGPLMSYIRGQGVNLRSSSGRHVTFAPLGEKACYNICSHYAFLCCTQQGMNRADDVLRRLDNIRQIALKRR